AGADRRAAGRGRKPLPDTVKVPSRAAAAAAAPATVPEIEVEIEEDDEDQSEETEVERPALPAAAPPAARRGPAAAPAAAAVSAPSHAPMPGPPRAPLPPAPPKPPPRKPQRVKKGGPGTTPPRWALPAAAVLLLVLGAGAVIFGNRTPPGPQELPITGKLSADELWQEYKQNPGAANRKFGNNLVVVSGKVSTTVVGKGPPRLVLTTPTGTRWGVECWFVSPDDLSGINAGQQVTVQGEVESRSKPTENVRVTMCKILEKS